MARTRLLALAAGDFDQLTTDALRWEMPYTGKYMLRNRIRNAKSEQ